MTLVHIVPTMLRMMVRELDRRHAGERPFPALRHLLVAGEPLLAGDVRAWHRAAGTEAEVVNLYGPTETTLAKMFHRVTALPEDPARILPIGHALPNTAALIINGTRLCRPGEIGEIHINTPYRSLGYFGDPELTAASFIPNPLNNEPDDILYKTGDLGRYLADGAVECLGRMDNQIKINGVRIELAEVEAALRDVAGVDQAVAAVHPGVNDQPCMVGYYTRRDRSTEPLATAAVHAELSRTLPAGMQPHFFMVLAELPQTISGKVNRKALPRPDELEIHQRIPFVAPQGELEESIARVWSELFGIARVSATTEEAFRELGGNSLKAIRAVMRMWEETGVEVALKDFFERSTIRGLAAFIALHRSDRAAPPIPRLEKAQSYPTSPSQQRLWQLDRMGIAATAYNLAEAYLLEGSTRPRRSRTGFHDPDRATRSVADDVPRGRWRTARGRSGPAAVADRAARSDGPAGCGGRGIAAGGSRARTRIRSGQRSVAAGCAGAAARGIRRPRTQRVPVQYSPHRQRLVVSSTFWCASWRNSIATASAASRRSRRCRCNIATSWPGRSNAWRRVNSPARAPTGSSTSVPRRDRWNCRSIGRGRRCRPSTDQPESPVRPGAERGIGAARREPRRHSLCAADGAAQSLASSLYRSTRHRDRHDDGGSRPSCHGTADRLSGHYRRIARRGGIPRRRSRTC